MLDCIRPNVPLSSCRLASLQECIRTTINMANMILAISGTLIIPMNKEVWPKHPKLGKGIG
jgi:hypothetical protein